MQCRPDLGLLDFDQYNAINTTIQPTTNSKKIIVKILNLTEMTKINLGRSPVYYTTALSIYLLGSKAN